MAATRVLIDTSILIEHLRKQNRANSILFNIVDSYDLYISSVVEFELYAGATDTRKQEDVREILTWCIVIPLTSDIARTAASIYRQLRATNQLVEIRDLFIAATALSRDLPLMTLNTAHFSRIDALEIAPTPQL